jgi:hypothetical protein
MTLEFTQLHYSQKFFAYLEEDDSKLGPDFMSQNKGIVIMCCIVGVEWPMHWANNLFMRLFDNFIDKIRHA